MSNAVKDLVSFLDDTSLGLTKGLNLFMGPIRPVSTLVPIDCVFVSGLGGPQPERVMGEALEVQFPVINITVRSHKFVPGDEVARVVQASLQGHTPTGYLDLVATQSEPYYHGADENQYHTWGLNYILVVEQART